MRLPAADYERIKVEDSRRDPMIPRDGDDPILRDLYKTAQMEDLRRWFKSLEILGSRITGGNPIRTFDGKSYPTIQDYASRRSR